MTHPSNRTAVLTQSQRYWLEHLQRQPLSGLSKAEYARQHGLVLKTFYNMRRRLRPFMEEMPSPQVPLFQAVTLRPAPVPDDGLTLLVQLPGRMTCEIPALDVSTCAALLRQLARTPE